MELRLRIQTARCLGLPQFAGVNSTVFIMLGTTNIPVVKHGNSHMPLSPKPPSSVTAPVHGEVQVGSHCQAASSTELSTKTAGRRVHKIPARACEPVSTKLSELTHNHILMPKQVNWVSPLICCNSLFPFCEVEITDSYLMRFYEVNSYEEPRHSGDEGRINTKTLCKHSNAKCLMQIPCSQSDFLSSFAQFLLSSKCTYFRWKFWSLCLKYPGWITCCVGSVPSWYVYLYKNVWVLNRSLGDFPCCASLLLGSFRRLFSFLMIKTLLTNPIPVYMVKRRVLLLLCFVM